MYFGEFLLFLFIKFVYSLSVRTMGDLATQIRSDKRDNEAGVDKRLFEINEKLKNLTKTLEKMYQTLRSHNDPTANQSKLVSMVAKWSGKSKAPSGESIVDKIEDRTEELVHLMESFFSEVEKLTSAEKGLVRKIVMLQIEEHSRASMERENIKYSLPAPTKNHKEEPKSTSAPITEQKFNSLRKLRAVFIKLFHKSETNSPF